MRVALATCLDLPEPDPDEAPLLEAFASSGVEATPLPWDDPSADPALFDAVILRATWNYYRRPRGFLNWAESVDRRTRLFNPLSVVRWNIRKDYLAELESQGIHVVPTVFFRRGQQADLDGLLSERRWREFVLKPTISASSYRTRKFSHACAAEARDFLARLLQDGDAMVQEYMESVHSYGERSLVWIGGDLSHAVRKLPRLEGEDERVEPAGPPTESERGLASRLLAPWKGEVLYARIDLMSDRDGVQRVSELELIEPSLFFNYGAGSALRFVAALVARLS